jgi:hypothetical protein
MIGVARTVGFPSRSAHGFGIDAGPSGLRRVSLDRRSHPSDSWYQFTEGLALEAHGFRMESRRRDAVRDMRRIRGVRPLADPAPIYVGLDP